MARAVLAHYRQKITLAAELAAAEERKAQQCIVGRPDARDDTHTATNRKFSGHLQGTAENTAQNTHNVEYLRKILLLFLLHGGGDFVHHVATKEHVTAHPHCNSSDNPNQHLQQDEGVAHNTPQHNKTQHNNNNNTESSEKLRRALLINESLVIGIRTVSGAARLTTFHASFHLRKVALKKLQRSGGFRILLCLLHITKIT